MFHCVGVCLLWVAQLILKNGIFFIFAGLKSVSQEREGVTRYVTGWLTLESLGDLFGVTLAIFAAWFKAHAFSRFFCLVENTV